MHTPEPWDVQNKGQLHERSARHEIVKGINRDDSVNLPRICKMPNLSEQSYADAARIVACVNGCTGIVNPAAIGDLLEAAQDVDEWHDLIKQNYPEMYRPFRALRAALAKAEGKL